MHRHLHILLALGLLSLSARASAQPLSPEVEAQHQEGNRLREQHRDEEARVIFQRLWESTHEARALARMALAENAVGRRVEAESHLAQALGMGSDPWIQQNRVVLESTLQQIRAAMGIATLTVACDAPGAEVFINGSRAGTVNTPLRASPGEVQFEVRAPGYVSASRSVSLRAGASARENVTLDRSGSAVAVAQPDTSGQPSPIGHPGSPEPSSGATRTLAWATGGGALVFLGVGALGYALGSSAADRWNSAACDPTAAIPSRGQRCAGDDSTAQTMGTLAVVGFVGGGVLAATSAVLFLVSGGGHREQATRAFVGCGMGPGELGVACGGRF